MTIAEASQKYGLTPDTLRYYERIGLIPPVRRTAGGIRDYDEEACRWIELMKCMRSAGVQIEALTEYVKLFQQPGPTAEARRQILADQRSLIEKRILEMQEALNRLNYKIERYDTVLIPAEKGRKG